MSNVSHLICFICVLSSNVYSFFYVFSVFKLNSFFYFLRLTFISVLCFSASDFYFVFIELVSCICKYALARMSFFNIIHPVYLLCHKMSNLSWPYPYHTSSVPAPSRFRLSLEWACNRGLLPFQPFQYDPSPFLSPTVMTKEVPWDCCIKTNTLNIYSHANVNVIYMY